MDSQGQYGLDVIGVNVTLTNASSEFLTIKSGQSSIAMGNYSGIPFLPGMAYRDAGNPSATPDIIIPPNQSVSKTFLVSSCMFSDGWNVYGVLLPKANYLTIALYLKVEKADSSAEYASVTTPAIGIF
jgi:hypothetical protein